MLLDPGLLSRLIGRALSRGGDFAEVYVQRRKSVGFALDDGVLRDASAGRDFGVGVRVVRGAAVTYAWSDDTSDAALLACADAAAHVEGAAGSPVVIARPLAPRGRPGHADPQRPPPPAPARRSCRSPAATPTSTKTCSSPTPKASSSPTAAACVA